MAKGKPPEFTEENVSQIVEMGFSRQDAIESLKACNNDVGNALEYIFTGGLERERQQRAKDSQWNENAFHEDRLGNLSSNTGQSTWDSSSDELAWSQKHHFRVQGEDVRNDAPARSLAPSPAEPNNFQYAATAPLPTPVSDTDDDLQRALKMSMEEHNGGEDVGIGNYGPQQSGVTGTNTSPANPNFRPATQGNYDMSKWSIVATNQREPPGPYRRRREDGMPAFLRPNRAEDYIPGFLTVMHSIASARNAFLAAGYGSLENYGYDPGFWNGAEIEIPTPNGGVLEDVEARLVYEVQRIIAFLDDTTRAYGSTESLPKPPIIPSKSDTVDAFATAWKAAIVKAKIQGADLSDLEKIITRARRVNNGEILEESEFVLMRLNVPETVEVAKRSLYEFLDNMIISEPEDEADVFFNKVGEVLALQLDFSDGAAYSKSEIDLPACIYLQRYTEEFVSKIQEIKNERGILRQRIEALREKKLRLTYVSKSDSEDWEPVQFNGIERLKKVVKEFERRVPLGDPRDAKAVQEYTRLIGLIEAKLKEIAEEDDRLCQQYRQGGSRYTTPEELPDGSEPHFLVGLVPDAYTTFVADKIYNQSWFKIQFSRSESSNHWTACMPETFTVEKATFEDVINASNDSKESSVLAVYAQQTAFMPNNVPVPAGLKEFVDRDNQQFETELNSSPMSQPIAASETSDSHAPNVLSPRPRRFHGIATPQDSTGHPSPEPDAQLQREFDSDKMDIDGKYSDGFSAPTELQRIAGNKDWFQGQPNAKTIFDLV